LATAPANVTIPAEVVYVVETGIAKSANPNKRREQLAKLLGIVTVLPFNVTYRLVRVIGPSACAFRPDQPSRRVRAAS
jgi:hypothetical protein